ncbi:MAG TPA: cell envelope integrity protein CreD, partial [Rubrivivax sp.]|nr:cell envelope integrity protein CreD [Rubrivivax sp.]
MLLLVVPLSLIHGIIDQRKAYSAEATQRIAQSSAGEQQVMAPLRVVPWTDTQEVEYTDDLGVDSTRVERTGGGTTLQTPATLDMRGEIVPDTRRLGLFEVRVYRWRATLSATFDAPLPQPAAVITRTYGTPYLVFGVSDVRGLVGTPNLRVDGQSLRFEPGTRHYAQTISGVSATLPAITAGSMPGRRVEMEFVLAGTQSLSIVPAADSNTIAVQSKWPHPSFAGDFLPTERKVHPQDRGFEARWDISSLASQAQGQIQHLGKAEVGVEQVGVERLKIALVNPVDIYTQADRASKYGLLFVLLTFVGFALFELIKRLPIHPLQYLLVGLALAIFFLLLLSLSEHIAFWKAYLASAAACIGLQFVYLSGVLRSWARALGFTAMLTALNGVLYSLLLSEYNALLMGSLLLFGILGAIMWSTRKVDWYELAASLR